MKWTSVSPLLPMSCLVSGLVALVLLPAPALANPQPVVGACCLTYGDCQVLLEYDCQQAGGSYQGDFTTCEPNPCSPAHFACCFPDGGCLVMTSPPLCESQGGIPQPVAACTPEACLLPPGVCCFGTGLCKILTQAACVELWGGWMGAGLTTCDPNPCPGCLLPCSSDACCLADGSCRLTWASTCLTRQGTWQGYGSTCSPNPCSTSGLPGPKVEIRTWGHVKGIYR
jgi:hypothetical protein